MEINNKNSKKIIKIRNENAKYLDKKFTGTKRFGLDGGESLVPAMEQIFKRGSQLGVQEIVLGMAHRGRLNVLANVMGKPFQAIFHEFQGGSSNPDDVGGSGRDGLCPLSRRAGSDGIAKAAHCRARRSWPGFRWAKTPVSNC